MNNTIKRILTPLSSLTLTVVLLALAMLLVYAGTWAQIDTSVWAVQKWYFHSFLTWIDFQTLLPRPKPGHPGIPGGFPMPGGYTLGLLMLANLVAAHVVRFNFTRKRIGIILIHLGLILLLVGEGITSAWAIESTMTIDERSYANYTQDSRRIELAVIDPSHSEYDQVLAIPQSRLASGDSIRDARLPFEIRVEEFHPNSVLVPAQDTLASRATAGAGRGMVIIPRRSASGTEAQSADFASAYVTLFANGQSLGTYLVSTYPIPRFDSPQAVLVNDKTYHLQLRQKRYYKPYTIHLLDFTHDRYPGTDIPKNFASHVRLVDPANHQDRQVHIRMNQPLRYAGETFYQSGFKPGDTTTILQVVSNPAWLLPYIACVIGGLGMTVHFGLHLAGFLRRQSQTKAEPFPATSTGRGQTRYTLPPARHLTQASFLFPAVITTICLVYLLSLLRPASQATPFDLQSFATLPVSFEGRIQPLDSLARNSLKILSGREALRTDTGRMPAAHWLTDMFANPEQADNQKVFRIDHPGLVSLVSTDADRKLFSFNELVANARKLEEQFALIAEVDPKQYDLYQKAVDQLRRKAQLYIMLQSKDSLFLVPPLAAGEDWQQFGPAMHVAHQTQQPPNPAVATLQTLFQTYKENRPADFNGVLRVYTPLLQEKLPREMSKVSFETFFNRYDPFMQCMVLYILVFLLASLSWLFWTTPLSRAAFWILILAFILHTLGLAGRIYISGRPPVTNLASSAIFIAWGAVALAALLERFFRNGVGSATAASLGFLSLLIADRLALQGDTLKVLVAVLDTNFWLATHVITITLGYASTFLAGFLGIVFVLRGLFTRTLNQDQSKNLARMIYGIVCFAMLFSFVGTILGGIWADQSWGRFWGWDPKENGAALLVLYNALILHARWAGMVRERGLALLAIGGNIVTSWSWFGTNMLGVGLHSYGFMDSALFWLLMFDLSQVLLIAVGSLPLHWWRSFGGQPHTSAPSSSQATPTT